MNPSNSLPLPCQDPTPRCHRPRLRPGSGSICQATQDRNRRVAAYQHMVKPLAHHYANCTGQCSDDLIQVGLMGLIRAAERFSSSQGAPFACFARPHIRGAILHYLRDAAHPVRLPRRQEELRHRLRQLERQLLALQEPGAMEAICCRRLGVSPEGLREIGVWDQLRTPCGLDADAWAAIPGVEADPLDDRRWEGHRARQLLAQLEPRSRNVVTQVILGGCSYRQVARSLGVSPMTVQRLLKRGLDELRRRMVAGDRTQEGSEEG